MSIEIDTCSRCNNPIIFAQVKTGSYIDCDKCGTTHKAIEFWNSEEEYHQRYLQCQDDLYADDGNHFFD